MQTINVAGLRRRWKGASRLQGTGGQPSAQSLGDFEIMPTTREDRHALILLVSLLVFVLASPFATEDRRGEIIFLLALYWTFFAATIELSPTRSLRVPSLILAVGSLSVALVAIYHPVRILLIINWAIMALFFGYVSIVLFVHLGKPGRITSGRLYVSVSLYLLLGIFYFTVFNLLHAAHPGSFVYAGVAADNKISRYSHLYFSLATLITLGYGDIVPSTPLARILAVLEAVTGVLYIAITVARLVAAYQIAEREGN
jgi:ion channel